MTYFLYTSLGILVILSIGASFWWYRNRRRLQNRRRREQTELDTVTQEEETSQSETAPESSNILFDLSESDDSRETQNPLPLLESPLETGRETQTAAEILNLQTHDDTEITDFVSKERQREEVAETGVSSQIAETVSAKATHKDTPELSKPSSKFSLFSFRKREAEPVIEERFTTTLSIKRRGATPRLEEDNHELPSKKRGAIRWSEEEPFSNLAMLDSHRHGAISPSPTTFPEEVTSATTRLSKSKSKTKEEFFLASPELILALYVVPQHGGFQGHDILDVLEELGLRYGDMKIFHHYGVGEIKVRKPVFSLANMLEPGTFDVQRISKFVSPGLVLFMRLPGPFGGRVAFELMLKSAQKIADILEGTLKDDKHQLLTPQTIHLLRERIANFERRDTPLSLRKRFS